MAVPVLHPNRFRSSARVRLHAVTPAGSELVVAGEEGVRSVAAWPDAPQADRVARSLDRIVYVRFELDGDRPRAVAVGVRRRRPIELSIGIGAALELLDRGRAGVVVRPARSA